MEEVKQKFYLRLNLQHFSEGDEPVIEESETVSDSVESDGVAPAQDTEVEEVVSDESQEESDPIDNSKAFAKRLEERTQAKLAEERQRWEQEQAERYGDYDHLKKVTDYLVQRGEFGDVQALNEAIELEMLQERAEKQNVSPEILQRIDELEAKAQKADYYEKQQEQQRMYGEYKSALDTFVEGKEVSAEDLEMFMGEHQIGNFEIAYKAMRAEQLEQKLANAEKEAVQKYLESKKGPRVEGTGAAGVVSDEPTTDFNVARQRALERLRAANQQQ
jgi:hypothetical protein